MSRKTRIQAIDKVAAGLPDPKVAADEKRQLELWHSVPLPIRLRLKHDMEKPDETRQVTEEDWASIPRELLEN